MEESTTQGSGDAPEKHGWNCPVSAPKDISNTGCHRIRVVSASEGVLGACVPEDGFKLCEDGGQGAPSPNIRPAGQGDVRAAWVNLEETCEDVAGRRDPPAAFAMSWRDRCASEEPTRVYTLSDHPGAPPYHCPTPLPSTDIPECDPEVASHTRTQYDSTAFPGPCPLETIPEADAQTLSVFTIPVEDIVDQPLDDSCIVELRILQKTEPLSVTSLTQGPHLAAKRCDSTLSTASEKLDICRICHCEREENNQLISPCLCSGSLKFIHLTCLQKWIKSSDKKSCELCNFEYVMTTKTKPFKQWEKLTMTSPERRKIICSVTFHIIAITCVIWSLYVLIDRSTEEVHSGSLDWPFWTKLIVVAIGFTGGLVFMYVQCKMYVQLCMRWRQFNKIITVENAPEDPQFRAEAAARIKAKSGEKTGVVNPVALQEVDSF